MHRRLSLHDARWRCFLSLYASRDYKENLPRIRFVHSATMHFSDRSRAFKRLGSVIGHRFFSRASVFFERKRLQLNLLCSFGLFSIRFVYFFIAGKIIGLRGKFLFFLMDNRGNTFFEGQIDVFITVSDFVDLPSLSYCLLFISIACCTLFFFTITDIIIFCFGV